MEKSTLGHFKLIVGFMVIASALSISIVTLVIQDSIPSPTIPPLPHSTQIVTVVAAAATLPTVVTPPSVIETSPVPASLTHKTYIEVTDGCAAHFQGECLLVRSGPGKEFSVVSKLRTGVVLRAADKPIIGADGLTWYKIVFDEWLRYPERVKDDWYVAAEYVKVTSEPTVPDYVAGVTPSTTKRIIVDRSEQRLFAYDNDELFMTATTSTGLKSTPTPRGVFTIYKKTPSRYMQGPLPYLDNNQYYDLPGVPWNLYFTEAGAVIHGAYWHTAFGTPYSHGCVNLSMADAHALYDWATVGTKVTVRD